MARGKDGFDSLLVKSEGGEAEEVVSEENGILISMMLRQYFMSLKIVGQWKQWGKSMDRHWKGVQNSMKPTSPVVEPRTPIKSPTENPGNPFSSKQDTTFQNDPTTDRNTGADTDDPLDESDEDVSADESEDRKATSAKREREIKLIQKVTRKWWRLAGLSGQPKCCDGMGEGEFTADWTRVSNILVAKKPLIFTNSHRQLHQE